ncbi:MAG: hypothetical protein HC859_11715 [Bacteroidia bacterium]|nr:hypothetical protein [Bacteroidia bacterium]
MKLFRDKPLSTQAAYLLVLLAVLLVAQFAYLNYRINRLNELHASADFARKAR